MKRNQTKVIHIGGVSIGGGSPVAIQSMTNTDTRDVAATVAQIHALTNAGCEIVRVAVLDTEAAEAIKQIKKEIAVPLVADIHFDYRLALESIKNGADKLRINPGNIGSENRVRQVTEAAKTADIPIRVGVNGGSLEKDILIKYGGVTAQGLAESALANVSLLEKFGFNNIVVSVKASDVTLMLNAHKILAERLPYPLHIGLTEAGTPYAGAIRSAVGMGAIMSLGLGDTLRVSLSGDPVAEIKAAKEILSAMGLRRFGVTVIACPTCGRCDIDVAGIATKLEIQLAHITTPMTIAVMGCVVNGPGEAREADIGIAGGRGKAVLFRKGEIIRNISEDDILDAVLEEVLGQ
ncbi:MAG: flavodoxin-dependent (E)-4-hydroxy-3-methylbut-2-enyl-diphosphate synthase [Defluviitaleaceae bacterium]|nr:flavodoxin-dependent (E)-4-hydroxy-3-methylbut-2-enyl-diphosphate synthase [Defluviitaleaceae bacterium]